MKNLLTTVLIGAVAGFLVLAAMAHPSMAWQNGRVRPGLAPAPQPEEGPGVRDVRPVERRPRMAAAENEAAEFIFVGRIVSTRQGPVAQSMPPIYTTYLRVQVQEVLRGDLQKGDTISVVSQARQLEAPQYNDDEVYIVSARKSRDAEQLTAIELKAANEASVKETRLLASLPVGWKIVDDKVVSPWTTPWPKEAAVAEGQPVCSKTGRPALLAGKGIVLKAEPVPPAVEVQWSNPDGDGQYRISVTNSSDKAVDVPALLSDETGILWTQSLLVFCQGKAQALPDAAALKAGIKATRLEPRQTVSTVVNILTLPDIDWPRGGYRISFTFCLGELASTQSFYYMSRHHDPLRRKATEAAPTAMDDLPAPAQKLPDAPAPDPNEK